VIFEKINGDDGWRGAFGTRGCMTTTDTPRPANIWPPTRNRRIIPAWKAEQSTEVGVTIEPAPRRFAS